MSRRTAPRIALAASTLVLAMLLTGCGGSGGTGGTGAVPLAPAAPPPPPPPPPPPESFNTAEFRANYGLDAINVLGAYGAGLSGAGVTVGVIDSGIDIDHPDLAANIHPASSNVNSGTSFNDVDGHGTAVSGVIAAVRNDIGTHGVAFNARVMALRADDEGSCADECAFPDTIIAAGIDHAVANGAAVINMSLGGSAPSFRVVQAVHDATQAGVVIVISAGNDGNADPDPFALIAADPQTAGRVIIAGASDRNNQIAGFSNRAGSGQDFFLMAPGAGINTTGLDGATVRVSGTSFSAPHIAGALALLIENFPTTDSATLIEILKNTAVDLGDPGRDAVFGWGLIDLTAALSPQGATSLPLSTDGDGTAALTQSGGQTPAAFGDALQRSGALASVAFTDRYDRTFRADLSQALTPAFSGVSLLHRLRQDRLMAYAAGAVGDTLSFSISAARRHELAPTVLAALSPLQQAEARRWQSPHFHLEGGWQKLRFDLNHGGGLFHGAATDRHGLSQAARVQPLFGGQDSTSFGLSLPLAGRTRLGIAAALDRPDAINDPRVPGQDAPGTRHIAAITLGAAQERHGWTVALGGVAEQDMVLGSPSAGALKLADGARTGFARLSGHVDVAPGWRLAGSAVAAISRLDTATGSLFQRAGALAATAFHAQLTARNLLADGDEAALRIAQPLRVEKGGIGAHVPVGRDLSAPGGAFFFSDRRIGLAPSGREIGIELGYSRAWRDGMTLRGDILYRHDAAHQAGRADMALLLRLEKAY